MKLSFKNFLIFFITLAVVIFFYIIFLFNQDVHYEKFIKLNKTLEKNTPIGKLYHFSFKTVRFFANEFDFSRLYYKFKEQEPKTLNLKMSSSEYADLKSQIELFKNKGFIKDELNEWRKSILSEKNDQYKIRYKIHGTSASPLRKGFFSLRVKFEDKGPYLNNQRELNFIRIYFDSDENIPTIIINNWANKIDLLSPRGETIILNINNVRLGLFYKQERHGKEWFEKQKITNYSILKNNDDWDKKIFGHVSDLDLNEKNIEVSGPGMHKDIALGSLKTLFDAIKSENLTTILDLIDVDYFSKFLAMSTIINDDHMFTGDNLKYIYDFTNGKFKVFFRYENSIIRPINGSIEEFNKVLFSHQREEVLSHKLFKILLDDNNFREQRDAHLQKIIDQKDNMINEAYNAYDDAYKNIIFSDIKLRHQKHLKKLFFKTLIHNFEKTSNYLSYAKIYMVEERMNDFIKLSLVNDSFVPIRLKSISFKKENNIKKIIRIEYENEEQYQLPPITISKNQKHHVEKEIYIHTDLLIDKIEFQNLITKNIVNQEHIYRNAISIYNKANKESLLNSLKFNNIDFQLKNKNLFIKKGEYQIAKNIITPAGFNTIIEKGSKFTMLKDISFLFQGNLSAIGTKSENISIKALNNNEPFGTFAVVGKDSKINSTLSNFYIEGGSEANIEGMVFLGQLSIHNSNVFIEHSKIIKSASDDGANIRNSNVDISHTIFSQNKFDQLDLDFCKGKLTNNKFINYSLDKENNSGGDGIDVSGSNLVISMNTIEKLSDKGISVGEKSKVILQENTFIENDIAIAIKDGSIVYNLDNTYTNNNLEISMYIKKFIFKKPILYLDSSTKSETNKKRKYKIVKGNIIFIDKIINSKFYKDFVNEIDSS